METKQNDFTLRTTETMMCYTLDTVIKKQRAHICVIVDLSVKSGRNVSVTIETPYETRYSMREVSTESAYKFDFFLTTVKMEAEALCGVEID